MYLILWLDLHIILDTVQLYNNTIDLKTLIFIQLTLTYINVLLPPYVPITSLIPAVWLTEPSVSGTTQVYSPVGDV